MLAVVTEQPPGELAVAQGARSFRLPGGAVHARGLGDVRGGLSVWR